MCVWRNDRIDVTHKESWPSYGRRDSISDILLVAGKILFGDWSTLAHALLCHVVAVAHACCGWCMTWTGMISNNTSTKHEE